MFKTGNRVRTIKEVRDVSWSVVVPAGIHGTLGRFYRRQDGLEYWSMWLDWSFNGLGQLLCVTDQHIEKEV